MKEHEILSIIKNSIGSEFIGDDCAYLKDLNIVISQDSLVEDIHFKRKWCTPYQLGYKSVTVNISDILASGAKPLYISISLSLPNNINEEFIKDFYNGAKSALNGSIIVGGDITGSSDKIFISIAAIGSTADRNISSRKNAKKGYYIITKGLYGSSAAGLNELYTNNKNKELIKAHLEPTVDFKFSQTVSTIVKEEYAMMDTSDGLADALFKIAEASNVKIVVDYNKIARLPNIDKDKVLFGGEDYNLIAAIPEKYLKYFSDADIIGYADSYDGIYLDISGQVFSDYNEIKAYNHFGDING